jgi:hypothetical protein
MKDALLECVNGEADVFPLAEGSMVATNRVSRVAATLPESKNSARSHMSFSERLEEHGGLPRFVEREFERANRAKARHP